MLWEESFPDDPLCPSHSPLLLPSLSFDLDPFSDHDLSPLCPLAVSTDPSTDHLSPHSTAPTLPQLQDELKRIRQACQRQQDQIRRILVSSQSKMAPLPSKRTHEGRSPRKPRPIGKRNKH